MEKEELKRAWEEVERERMEHNDRVLQVPVGLSSEEETAYSAIAETIKQSIKYRLTSVDVELIWQYCQLKVMRDRAWKAYNLNPERYIRIVTGICPDGKTPKIIVKENEHYKTLQECNRHLEKILKDLRLTPEARSKDK